jgi:hypothetical protein
MWEPIPWGSWRGIIAGQYGWLALFDVTIMSIMGLWDAIGALGRGIIVWLGEFGSVVGCLEFLAAIALCFRDTESS